MILAYHCIFGFYGFWLPNDRRGSGSDYVASRELFQFGPATKVSTRHTVAGRPHDHGRRLAAKQALRHPPVRITGIQALAVANGFRKAAEEGNYAIHACAIMPDHVHVVIGRHDRPIRQIVGHLKARATSMLRQHQTWPADDRPIWGEHGRNVFLNDQAAVKQAIRYVEQNPTNQGKKRQQWSFVTKFEVGHL